MSEENKKKHIEDPLAGFGIVDGDNKEIFNKKPKEKKPPKEKEPSVLCKKLKALSEKANEPVDNKKALKIIGIAAAAALVIALAAFIIYTSIPVRSHLTVEQWAENWNALSYTDFTAEDNNGSYCLLGTMLSATDYKLTEEKIQTLKDGKSVRVFDDTAVMVIKTAGDSIISADLQVDIYSFAEKYGDEMKYTNIEDGAYLRAMAIMGQFVSAASSSVNTSAEAFTAGRTLNSVCMYVENYGTTLVESDEEGHGCWSDDTFRFAVFRSVSMDKPVSGTDVTDTDTILGSIKMKMNVHMDYKLKDAKLHQPNWDWDWSWFKNLFGGSADGASQTTAPETVTTPTVSVTDTASPLGR